MTVEPADGPRIVGEALAHAAAGDPSGGAELLIPLIEAGPVSTYALAGMLAEAACYIARRDYPGAFFGLGADNKRTRQPASVDDFKPSVVSAARFVAAWANRDQDTATALFLTLYDGPEDDFIDALTALFEMAVATAAAVQAEERRARRGRDTR
ncbi:hypothetical protein [Streptomyces sp. NPDC059063]|uniref:hypothetical protein n=1 Tax=Streptomyces sp. NPDC059063 TaxID=3346712 RepID=UPI0036C8C540